MKPKRILLKIIVVPAISIFAAAGVWFFFGSTSRESRPGVFAVPEQREGL